MIMSEQIPTRDDLQRDDDAGIAALLREVGAGAEPPREIADEIRLKVHADWKAIVEARARRKRFVGFGIAASVLGVTASVLIAWRLTSLADPVVTVARVLGVVERIDKDGKAHALRVGERIAVGELVQSSSDAKLALDFGPGLTARLDGESKLRLNEERHVELSSGAVYVDAAPGSKSTTKLIVDTAFGSVRHLGTQYQVRIVDEGLDVGVREGKVEVSHSRGTHSGAAGEWMHLSKDGDVVRQKLTPSDSRWAWVMYSAPVFDIADRSLLEFLEWVARETGKELVFDSPQAKDAAAAVKLRGSIEGLDLETAIVAVLSTTQLKRTPSEDEAIRIVLSQRP
jgi:hypothetical protein